VELVEVTHVNEETNHEGTQVSQNVDEILPNVPGEQTPLLNNNGNTNQ
jgi:hypothetical protein